MYGLAGVDAPTPSARRTRASSRTACSACVIYLEREHPDLPAQVEASRREGGVARCSMNARGRLRFEIDRVELTSPVHREDRAIVPRAPAPRRAQSQCTIPPPPFPPAARLATPVTASADDRRTAPR